MNNKARKVLKIVGISVGGVLAIILSVVGAFVIFASATELKVQDKEKLKVSGDASKDLLFTENVSILSWNIGYGANDKESDFALDGGKEARAESKAVVEKNVAAMKDVIKEGDYDIVALQEVDYDSDRSHKVNEPRYFFNELGTDKYQSTLALNYKAGYVPYPLFNTIGRVNSGLQTLSKFEMVEATRYQLPVPFVWPISTMNLKRCMSVTRFNLKASEKQLVYVNVHLEAYDSGEGKIKQTKMLKEFINKEYENGNYVIAGGDLNQVFSSFKDSYPLYGSNWKAPVINESDFENFQCVMDDTIPTCRLLDKPYSYAYDEKFQHYMLDGYFVSKNLEIIELETLDKKFENSDHNPVKLTVKFKIA